MLYGREAETSVIDELLATVRSGRSGALVIRGEPGIGKTALLDYAAGRADGIQVIRRSGVPSESELAYAGLHLLLRPALDRTDKLPPPQRRALEAALGLTEAQGADALLVGLAALSLLAEVSEDGPVLCLIDDAHWLDPGSRAALSFAARRLDAEGLALIMATREDDAHGLPEITLTGLASSAAAALLKGSDLTPAQRYRVLAEAQGNPLALIELPAALRHNPHEPGALPLSSRLQSAFHSQVDHLPAETQTLLLVAAAGEGLDEVLAAAAQLGVTPADLGPAETEGLVTTAGQHVRFRHPLIREAVYQRAPISSRLAVHAALARALNGDHHADRRAWHLAAATVGPDEDVAAELERTAQRAARRHGYAAAATAYQRAASLTHRDDEARAREIRARRLTLAAESATEAGELDRAQALAGEADALTSDSALRSRIVHTQATTHFGRGQYREAHRLMTEAALLDPALLVRAYQTAWYAGEAQLVEVSARLARALSETLLDEPVAALARLENAAFSRLFGGDPTPLDRAVAEAGDAMAAYPPGLAAMVCGAPLIAGQDAATLHLSARLIARCHAEGSIGVLPMVLYFQAQAELFHSGRFHEVGTAATTALRLAENTGQHQWAALNKGLLTYLAAVEGDEEGHRRLAAEVARGPAAPMQGAMWTDWARALLDLGQGRAETALGRLEALTQGPGWYHVSAIRCVPDLVEAAVRSGEPDRARPALARYLRLDQRHLIERCLALLAGNDAEAHYLAALDAGGPAFEHARTRLLYGEWLRRTRRRAAAAGHLREAMESFRRLGAAPWAGRARAELQAAGDPAAAPAPDRTTGLTPQERQIVRLAARGLSNKDIAAQLFLSPRTVGYHLYKAYPKLGVASRGELAALADLG
ncbi:DNA-binding CsgD family transcriptional regulator [Nonomuraea thailandensis]|uniref:DNA-binding CsgD family transcriptional regulator n=1 Tax=Nonomuraea thailandensis TaxID=1188745 RepID=A0A9X2GHD3_9ACTN|nr:helix-turn-helix transcriptional regulator [Nonomuraea thailandensis]MCP2354723.1 DNA-binding CsgD family transcriptional regulator [Nonomuraea thailandensis]